MGPSSHRETLPENAVATSSKGALNESTNPLGTIVEDDQPILGSPGSLCAQGAARMAGLFKAAQRDNGIIAGTVAGMIGKDGSFVSRAFDEEDPHHVLRALAALLLLDKTGTFSRGFCRLTGRECIDRPRLSPEQKLARLESALRKHGPMGEALLAEAYEDAP